MFVQVTQARPRDPDALRQLLDRWAIQVAPGAVGWLGTTAGVTEDGTLVMIVRFSSEEEARIDAERPEQSRWRGEFEALLTGEVSVDEATRIVADVPVDATAAGFVQVLRGHVSDPDRAFTVMNRYGGALAAQRPEILERLAVQHEDGRFTLAVHFTSEDDARQLRAEPPPELAQQLGELEELLETPIASYDLHRPWVQVARVAASG